MTISNDNVKHCSLLFKSIFNHDFFDLIELSFWVYLVFFFNVFNLINFKNDLIFILANKKS